MIDSATGYDSTVYCECRYDEAADEMIRDDCPVHCDIEGAEFPGGLCCPLYAAEGRHASDCGNRLLPDHELDVVDRRPPQAARGDEKARRRA
jgi:hypothetical protein